MKKAILHIIESLAIGGAEVLLTESLKGMSDKYRHVLVYLRPPATLLPEVKAAKTYCLHYKGKSNILLCILRMRSIIRQENASLIHAHHYWPTIIARFAKPRQVPLVFTVHNLLSYDAFRLNRLSLYLERLSYRRNQHAVFVSKAALKDYDEFIGLEGSVSVVYNFVNDAFYSHENASLQQEETGALRLVAVGNLKNQKNYSFLLEIFKLLKNEKIYLDIIGEGPLRNELANMIQANGLDKVKIRGASEKVVELLPQYDAFILASIYEGMSLAIIEAMAMGLPCILSDIEPNREVAGDAALFFNLNAPEDCAGKLIALLHDQKLLKMMSVASKEKALYFKKERYINEVEQIYNQYLAR